MARRVEVGGNEQRQVASGYEDVGHPLESTDVIADVLEDVDADDRVEVTVTQSLDLFVPHRPEVGLIELALGPIAKAMRRVGQDVGLDIQPMNDVSTSQKVYDAPHAAPNLENPLPQVGTELIQLPSRVGAVCPVEGDVPLETTRDQPRLWH